jgi:hypothetical protein
MAKMHVFSVDETVDLVAVKVKKPYTVNENIYIFDISYDNNALMMQTTPCVIPYSYYIFDNKSFQLDVHSCSHVLKEFLNKTNEHILSKIKKFDTEVLSNKMFIDYLKEVRQEPKNEYRLRLRNINVHNVNFFDHRNNSIAVSTLQTFDRVICLFQLQRLVVQKDTYYFQASVVQIKKLNTPLVVARECLIQITNNEFEECELSVYDGVPIQAIEHKKQEQQQTTKNQNKPQNIDLFEQIKKGIQLRDSKHSLSSTEIDHRKHVSFQPSLSDILSARNKLKRVL